ncbi:MAG: cob(I)yrinic acid a,c-diamide adenosyltransferase [Selenomonadaceae bacterium]|nr:cob(I)yrinic acid a,c-diamide adenosyltransferase [Selenomonadaceae bacterium]MBQ5585182.1 cob(I)yrinic acid a,c-diamide adenosyltransferase [Selenomonadaceae bacterium]MBQ5732015.1 cob(I)yrinic acid a,c-diamide adenosyltransferase [Selenomonadaceae bacterium]MBQ5845723.1 cob(I)yrinic acid a,c-diamide adenosyltransferase [Selenomonadaceae bacterium]MBQ5920462.1 cob(I)yrinic acid a,c-diamide adenosyltransferase [Selenomonadaceae bacterium]
METKGLILVHTGDGKGKTTAGLGLALRAWGSGLRVLILQFIKGGWKYGELEAIERLGQLDGRIEIRPLGLGLMRSDEDREKHIRAAAKALQESERMMVSGQYDLIIFDEINYAVKFGLISLDDVLALLDKKPEKLHVLLTGRDARPELIERADLVTEMKLVKHPYQQGIKAQQGIEF